jgi:hypothetical protein
MEEVAGLAGAKGEGFYNINFEGEVRLLEEDAPQKIPK